jgi:hypothetical protein
METLPLVNTTNGVVGLFIAYPSKQLPDRESHQQKIALKNSEAAEAGEKAKRSVRAVLRGRPCRMNALSAKKGAATEDRPYRSFPIHRLSSHVDIRQVGE